MSVIPTTKTTNVWTEQLIQASDFTFNAGDIVPALTSDPIENLQQHPIRMTTYNALHVFIRYTDLNPDPTNNFGISCLVESKGVNGWYNTINQFNPFRRSDDGAERILILQPDMDNINAGVDDIVFPIDRAISRISRSQGALRVGEFRLKVIFQDNNPNGPNPFVSVKITAEVEQYNV